jgi:hypothetical protein
MFFGRNTSGRGKSKLLLVASIAGQIFAAGSADAQTKGARFLPIQSISYRLGTGVDKVTLFRVAALANWC